MIATAIVTLAGWSDSATRARALERLLAVPLHEFATTVGRTLVAAAHRYAFPRTGAAATHADGGLVYDVRGRFEGEAIIPARAAPPARTPSHD